MTMTDTILVHLGLETRTTDNNDGHHTCSLRLGNYQLCVDFHCAGKILKSAYLGKG
jgi:hypothetical protein